MENTYSTHVLHDPQKSKILQADFFERSATKVARELLGKMLCRCFEDGQILKLCINEVEAYGGMEDLASHARFGLTKRNSVMFGPAGYWYVYLCYGIHWMLNIVTETEGKAGAVLLRGVGNYKGPGRLTKVLCIDDKFTGKACSPMEKLWVEQGTTKNHKTLRTPRIGIDYAGTVWAKKMYRFVLQPPARDLVPGPENAKVNRKPFLFTQEERVSEPSQRKTNPKRYES